MSTSSKEEDISQSAVRIGQYITWHEGNGLIFQDGMSEIILPLIKHINQNVEPLDEIGGRLLTDALKILGEGDYEKIDADSIAEEISSNYPDQVDEKFKKAFQKDLIENDEAYLKKYADQSSSFEHQVRSCLELKMQVVTEATYEYLKNNLNEIMESTEPVDR